MLKNPVFSTIIATILFAGTLAVLLTVAAFGMIRVLSEAVEAIGYLPVRWGENNIATLFLLALVVSLPITIAFVMWFVKRAHKAEVSLVGYTYGPSSK